MVVVKWPDKVEGLGEKIDDPLCGGLYREDYKHLFPWSETEPNAKMNFFACS